jgi:hypothetical protein
VSLDDELRRHFDRLSSGDLLDLRIQPLAEYVIVAGARRVRRWRRLGLAVGVAVLLVLGWCGIVAMVGDCAPTM